MYQTHRRSHRLISAVTGLALLLVACGDDKDSPAADAGAATTVATAASSASTGSSAAPSSSATSSSGSATEPSASPTDGDCGPKGWTDPAERSQQRQVARCAPNTPAPQPLKERQKIRISAATGGEYLAPIYVAQAAGEFDKENLDVEVVKLPMADGLAQIGAGSLDAASGGVFAAFMNVAGAGIPMKFVVANYSSFVGGDLTKPQNGLWLRRDAFSDPQNPNLAELKGKNLASSAGLGSTFVYWMGKSFADAGISLTDVTFTTVPPIDQFSAMENGAVVGAFMLDPYWQQAAAEPDKYVLVSVQPPEPNGGVVFSPSLLTDRREVGLAFVRAYIRAISTYLDQGYHDDDKVVGWIANGAAIEPARIKSNDELRFEWEIRSGLTDDLQGWYRKLNVQTVPQMPEDQLVDRSLYEEAVGHTS